MRTERGQLEAEQFCPSQTAQLTVEAEAALGGGLREEARVLAVCAEARPGVGEAASGKLQTQGQVIFHVLYTQGDPTQVRAVEASAPYRQALSAAVPAEAGAKTQVFSGAQVLEASARAFNGRMLCKSTLEISAFALQTRALSPVTAMDSGAQAETETREVTVQRTVGQGRGDALLREDIEQPQNMDIRETLFAHAYALPQDVQGGADGRALVSGTLYVDAYHACASAARPLLYTHHSLPFELSVTTDGEHGEQVAASVDVLDVAAAYQDAGERGGVTRLEAQLRAELQSVKSETVLVMTDAYATGAQALDVRTDTALCRVGLVNAACGETVKCQPVLPDGAPRVRSVLATFVSPVMTSVQRESDELAVTGVSDVTVLYLTADSAEPQTFTTSEPFRALFPCASLGQDSLALTARQAESSLITADRLDTRYILQLSARGVMAEPLSVVTDVLPVDAPPVRRGISAYFTQPGDTLWDVGKRFRMPVSELMHRNDELRDIPPRQPLKEGTLVMVYKRA